MNLDKGYQKRSFFSNAANSYFDKLVQPSYTLSTQIRPKATPRACLAMLCKIEALSFPRGDISGKAWPKVITTQ